MSLKSEPAPSRTLGKHVRNRRHRYTVNVQYGRRSNRNRGCRRLQVSSVLWELFSARKLAAEEISLT